MKTHLAKDGFPACRALTNRRGGFVTTKDPAAVTCKRCQRKERPSHQSRIDVFVAARAQLRKELAQTKDGVAIAVITPPRHCGPGHVKLCPHGVPSTHACDLCDPFNSSG